MAQKLRVPIPSETEVTAMHKLPSNRNKIPGVMVRFSRQARLASKFNLRKTYLQNNYLCSGEHDQAKSGPFFPPQRCGLGNMAIKLHGTKMEKSGR